MVNLVKAVESYEEFVREYGEPEEIAAEEIPVVDEARIWTLVVDEHEELFPGRLVGDDPIDYYQTPRARQPQTAVQSLLYYVWADCPTCGGADDEGCQQCEGGNLVGISIPSCVGLRSEKEILARGTS